MFHLLVDLESETMQVMKLGNGCESESSSGQPMATPRTYTEPIQTSNIPRYVYTPFNRPLTTASSAPSSSSRRYEYVAGTPGSSTASISYISPVNPSSRTVAPYYTRLTTLPYYHHQIYTTTRSAPSSSTASFSVSEAPKGNLTIIIKPLLAT